MPMRPLRLVLLGSLLSSAAFANTEPFEAWMKRVRADAKKRGVSEKTLTALDAVAPLPEVIEFDRKPIEKRLTYQQYIDRILSPKRLDQGRGLLAENRALLTPIEERHGVEAETIVALWG